MDSQDTTQKEGDFLGKWWYDFLVKSEQIKSDRYAKRAKAAQKNGSLQSEQKAVLKRFLSAWGREIELNTKIFSRNTKLSELWALSTQENLTTLSTSLLLRDVQILERMQKWIKPVMDEPWEPQNTEEQPYRFYYREKEPGGIEEPVDRNEDEPLHTLKNELHRREQEYKREWAKLIARETLRKEGVSLNRIYIGIEDNKIREEIKNGETKIEDYYPKSGSRKSINFNEKNRVKELAAVRDELHHKGYLLPTISEKDIPARFQAGFTKMVKEEVESLRSRLPELQKEEQELAGDFKVHADPEQRARERDRDQQELESLLKERKNALEIPAFAKQNEQREDRINTLVYRESVQREIDEKKALTREFSTQQSRYDVKKEAIEWAGYMIARDIARSNGINLQPIQAEDASRDAAVVKDIEGLKGLMKQEERLRYTSRNILPASGRGSEKYANHDSQEHIGFFENKSAKEWAALAIARDELNHEGLAMKRIDIDTVSRYPEIQKALEAEVEKNLTSLKQIRPEIERAREMPKEKTVAEKAGMSR